MGISRTPRPQKLSASETSFLPTANVMDVTPPRTPTCARNLIQQMLAPRLSFASFTIVSDATQQELYISKDAAPKYGRGEQKPNGPAICQVLVQLQSLFIPGCILNMMPTLADFLVPPFVLQDETAANLVGALLHHSLCISSVKPLLRFIRYFFVKLVYYPFAL